MAVFTIPSERYQTDLSQILFGEFLVHSYVQTNTHLQLNIPAKRFLLNNKDWYCDRFQKDHNYSTSSS